MAEEIDAINHASLGKDRLGMGAHMVEYSDGDVAISNEMGEIVIEREQLETLIEEVSYL